MVMILHHKAWTNSKMITYPGNEHLPHKHNKSHDRRLPTYQSQITPTEENNSLRILNLGWERERN